MSDRPPPQGDMARWEAEFNQLMSAQREDGEDDLDYTETMKEAWEGGMGRFGDLGKDREDESDLGGLRFDDDGAPILGEYVFGMSPFSSYYFISLIRVHHFQNQTTSILPTHLLRVSPLPKHSSLPTALSPKLLSCWRLQFSVESSGREDMSRGYYLVKQEVWMRGRNRE